MRTLRLPSGVKPFPRLPVQKRVMSSRAYESAPKDATPGLLPETAAAPDAQEVGAQLQKIPTLQTEIEKVREVINSPAPVEDKGKMLASQIESLTTEALEKGADAEAEFLQQVKVYLPEDIATRITTPETPASKARVVTTSSSPVVTELPDDIELN